MTRPSHCACGTALKQPHQGRTRFFCAPCAQLRQVDCVKKSYALHRKNNPAWRAENKRRAKAWRAKNKDYIRKYHKAWRAAQSLSV